MVIEVMFSGLMIICLSGQQDCPTGSLGNTAWVVQADGTSNPCYRPSNEVTQLEVRFPTAQFFKPSGSWSNCKDDKDSKYTQCNIYSDADYPDLCVVPKPPPTVQQLDDSLRQMPRLAEIDRRFKTLNVSSLYTLSWVPIRIQFPPGEIGAGPTWPPSYPPIEWLRSDSTKGGSLPRALSDRLKVTYQGASELAVTNCDGKSLIVLRPRPSATNPEVTFRNRAKDDVYPYSHDGYDDLTFLAWYYRLGSWDTTYGTCPDFRTENPVVLRCKRTDDTYCARPPGGPGDTTHWPPMMGQSF
jgi:hypothetical protein